MNLTEFVVLCFATWRISSFLVNETGPFDVFMKMREAVGITHDEDKKVAVIPERFLPQLLSCMWCTSVWVGFMWVLLFLLFPQAAFWIALGFAVSAGAIILEK